MQAGHWTKSALTLEIAANKTTPDKPPHRHISEPLGSSDSPLAEQAGDGAAAREQRGASTPGLDEEETDGNWKGAPTRQAALSNPS